MVSELLRQFPDAPALTLAKRAYREHPALWSSLETCRTMFRHKLGVQGHKNRKHTPRFGRPPRQAGYSIAALPAALSHFDDWRALKLSGPLRVLVLADLHVPYHDNVAIDTAIRYGLDHQADCVLLNGDVVDFFGLSMWEKDPRKRDVPAEVRAGRQFIKALRQAFPTARIVWKEGNHEERWERYLRLKAPELLGLDEFEWHEVYGLSELKIEHVGDKRPVKLGELAIIHGHEYSFAIANPVNPARGLYLRGKVHAMCGHFHQSSQHSEKDLNGHVVSTFSTGCLSDLHPDYRPLNNWCHGFAFVESDKAGRFTVQNLRIIKGKAY